MSSYLGSLRFRSPTTEDGKRMWRLAANSGRLDLNSPYAYVMMGKWLSDTCLIAERKEDGREVGFITGFRMPADPQTLFIWQVAVDASCRGRGVALAMLNELTAELDVRYVETTISPGNSASRRLFQKWADSLRTALTVTEGFREDHFPGMDHEREELFRIGPIVRDLESD
ncbi:diaminobutyrate acetyltransferase [Cohnella lubricantis]|uniref:L-2,4-diaminobutyric acid acetyltransferase n=1 Tax=Cohnella lubricantis TaxID=2163172 RepID=A0A841TIB6_9BACL|nr:diaminobutyrate acetyltransferase [Cohnella lubricantis]MBB6678221.1 diaminobutyrate acetyltransferase [Cohnella lubricantis]MBP2120076.1 L-2,4-diaminobutyric acid acetyltransferase [Cohnella lubricantis]